MLSEFPVWFVKISIMTVLIFTYFFEFSKALLICESFQKGPNLFSKSVRR